MANRVLPPRKPRGEPAKITIANQDNQIRMLVSRVQEVVRESNVNYANAKGLSEELTKANQDRHTAWETVKFHQRNVADLEKVIQRMEGWQDCAREILQSKSTGE